MKLEDLNREYDKMQQKYGAQELDSIYMVGAQPILISVSFSWILPVKTLLVLNPGMVANHHG